MEETKRAAVTTALPVSSLACWRPEGGVEGRHIRYNEVQPHLPGSSQGWGMAGRCLFHRPCQPFRDNSRPQFGACREYTCSVSRCQTDSQVPACLATSARCWNRQALPKSGQPRYNRGSERGAMLVLSKASGEYSG